MRERYVGYFLLISGIIVMILSLYFTYSLFTNKIKPFQVFRGNIVQTKQQPPASIQDLLTNPSAITQMQSAIISQVLEKQLNGTMNMGVTLVFMYFVMLFGYRIASLGVQLVRPIQVILRESKEDEKKEKIPQQPPQRENLLA